MNLLWLLLIGLVAGWLAGVIMKGKGFGLLGDLVLGVLGALLGGFLFGLLGIATAGLLGTLVMATVGAIVLLLVLGRPLLRLYGAARERSRASPRRFGDHGGAQRRSLRRARRPRGGLVRARCDREGVRRRGPPQAGDGPDACASPEEARVLCGRGRRSLVAPHAELHVKVGLTVKPRGRSDRRSAPTPGGRCTRASLSAGRESRPSLSPAPSSPESGRFLTGSGPPISLRP